jgi:carboxylesterase type B
LHKNKKKYCIAPSGLFQRAIVQSGSALNPWATLPESSRVSLESAANVGCAQSSLSELTACLRKVPAMKFAEEGVAVKTRERRLVEFAPSVEPQGTVDPFLPRDPRDLPLADVPVMAGVTTHEGMLHILSECCVRNRGNLVIC